MQGTSLAGPAVLELCWRRAGGGGRAEPRGHSEGGKLGGKGGRPLGVSDTTWMENKGKTLGNGTHVYHLCCLFTFYFDFFAFPLSLDNETTLVSFIPVSIKLSFPSWFSYTCCCVLVQSPPGSVGKQAGTLRNPLVFSGSQCQKETMSLILNFVFKKKT